MAKTLSASDRIELACTHLNQLVDHLVHSIALSENNQIFIFSDAVRTQVPASHAAGAYNLTRDALFRYSVLRLCAMWDDDDSAHTESIPTVVTLIDDRSVILDLMRETCGHWAGKTSRVLNTSDSPEEQKAIMAAVRASEDSFGRRQGIRAARELKKIISVSRQILASSQLASLRNFRNKHLAHSLRVTKLEMKVGQIPLPKYRAERELLEQTIAVVHALYCWVNGKDFDFDGSQEIGKSQAEALWQGCKITVLR